MRPDKILYVDDEPMALKYFGRLVSPIAPVLTASSVEEGKALLDDRAREIAVLVSDQRMPAAAGNELLRYAREHHPSVVRMLTTAHSDLGEAIEAINSGEIYRYITKPWELDSLRADLRNALEWAGLRAERDSLLREKMLIRTQQLLGVRIGHLAVVFASLGGRDESLLTYLEGATWAGCRLPQVDWRSLDHSDLMQAEASRSVSLSRQMTHWLARFGPCTSPAAAATVLAAALPQQVCLSGQRLHVPLPRGLYGALDGEPGEPVTAPAAAWLAWLAWFDSVVQLESRQDGSWDVTLDAPPGAALRKDWLASCIERLGQLEV